MADTGFDELRDLASAAGDKVSLAMAMAGWVPALVVHSRFREASELASELTSLLESIGDPTLTLGLSTVRWRQNLNAARQLKPCSCANRMIELADGDATRGNFIVGSPLVGAIMLGGCARCLLGDQQWRTTSSGPQLWPVHSTRHCVR